METTATRPLRYSRWIKAVAFILACAAVSVALSVLLVEENKNWMIDPATTGYFSFSDTFSDGDYTESWGYELEMGNVQRNIAMMQQLEIMKHEILLATAPSATTEPTEQVERVYIGDVLDTDAPATDASETPMPIDEPTIVDATDENAYRDTVTGENDEQDYDVWDDSMAPDVYEEPWEPTPTSEPAFMPDYGSPYADYYYEGYTGMAAIMRNIQADVDYLNSVEGLVYYVESEMTGAVYTNRKDATFESVSAMTYSRINRNYPGGVAAFTDEYIAEMNQPLLAYRTYMRRLVALEIVCVVVFLLSVAYLFFAAGRNSSERKIVLVGFDRLYTELLLAAWAGVYPLLFAAMVGIHDISSNRLIIYPVFLPFFAFFAALGLAIVLSIVRRIKHRTIFTHSLIFRACAGVRSTFMKIFSAQPFVRKVLISVIGLGCLTYVSGMSMVIFFFAHRSLLNKSFLGLLACVGLLSVPFTVWLAVRSMTKLTSIQDGLLNEEMSRRLRAERLRTELISNVSHDIRTPLTSVITYVDLLKSENVENEKARDYIEVIAAKSQRLKSLTDDLFEASKAASGNLPVTYETIDLNELITQGLGEMDAKIRESGLDIRFSESEETAVISADGKLLWRVVENLLSNVFKYALPASRVYIEVATDETHATLAIKNISAEELNIPAEELLERFRRGDEARGGEGSGLGLSIAQSLTEAMGGRFGISVDGDLFKATVTLVKI